MQSINYYLKNPRKIGIGIIHKMYWLPDKLYLQLLYYFEMGKILHLKHPKTFQEKLQWLKLHNRHPEYTTLVDKYSVKEHIVNIIGQEYIIPTLGVWDKFEEINFEILPKQFVLKTTHGGGNGGVVICRDKANFDRKRAKKILERSLSSNIYDHFKEWPYKDVRRRIIAEQFISMPGKDDLTDYKIYCFHGEPRYIQVIQDRNTHETIDFFDTEWNHQEFFGLNPIARPANLEIARPINLDKMLSIAKVLSRNTYFLRVDLYNIEEKIYFGELTFFPASGFGTFTPKEWNIKLGNLIELPSE